MNFISICIDDVFFLFLSTFFFIFLKDWIPCCCCCCCCCCRFHDIFVLFLFCSSLGGLPFYCLHDLRFPHARQALLCPGFDERRWPALSSLSARRLQRAGDAFLRRRSHSRYLNKEKPKTHFVFGFFFLLSTTQRVPLLCLFIFTTTIIKDIIGGTVNTSRKDYTLHQKKKKRVKRSDAKGGPWNFKNSSQERG